MFNSAKEEAPVTVLSSWCLRWNKTKSSIVIYGRRLVNGRLEERFWRTSSVVKAFTPVLVITRHKSLYSLIGELNWQQSNLNSSILPIFSFGFPSNWKSILLDNIRQDEIKDIHYQQSIVYDDCGSVYITKEEPFGIPSGVESRTGLRERYRRTVSEYDATRNEDICKVDKKNVDSESFKVSRYSSYERRRRGQTETEKLCHSLRYTGWQKRESTP
ncbi:hypothetical protein GpartN1_g5100.t1 [Galdieria partita]|uniref:SANTA domain-containing protein n=1 Tax=Galdieria partita TaxID=83374 RepID=A0A9C7Q015_9RHOD|nr:hypothetical protein GpartN1_g5100.t1 [Galdieria partita]